MPRSTVTARMACSMAASTTATTPSARSTQAPSKRLGGGGGVEGVESGEGGAGRDAAEDEIGVGHGRRRTAPPVAGRAGFGPGALRPDDQGSAGVEAGDGPAAGADGVDVEGGEADREAAHRPARGGLGHTPCTRQTSVEVPPMSKVTASG